MSYLRRERIPKTPKSKTHTPMALRDVSLNQQVTAKAMAKQETQQLPPQQHPAVVIISVEAAIASGKSSLLRMLQRRTCDNAVANGANASTASGAPNWKWVFVQEPVEMWQDVRRFNSRAAQAAVDSTTSSPVKREPSAEAAAASSTNNNNNNEGEATNNKTDDEEFNLLGKFYSSPPEFAFKLQSWAVLSRIETVARTLEQITRDFVEGGDRRPVLLVLERSWDSDRNTFATMHRDSGTMSPLEWVMYDQMYCFAARNSPTIDGHVYLECSADTCMTRLKKRDRKEETGVSAEYQRSLIKRHEEWLDTVARDQVLRLDVDEEFLGKQERADWIFNEICGFAASFFNAKQSAAAMAQQQQPIAAGTPAQPTVMLNPAPTPIVINGAKIRVA